MSLLIWLPLIDNTENQGLANINMINHNVTSNTAGKLGNCYQFNGSTAYINENSYDWTKFNVHQFTLCCWYKEPSPVASGNSQIIHIGTSSGWNNIRIGLLRRTSNGYPLFSISDGTNNINYNFAATSFSLDVWHHIAVTYDNGKLTMYLDGQVNKTMTTTIVPVITASHHLGIGGAADGAEKLTGFLNDVRIYDTALSPREIKEIAKGLVLHYTLAGVTPQQLYGEDFTYIDGIPTLSGDIVTFNAPQGLEINDLKAYINPIQDLHGYDCPWPGGGNINKLNLSTATRTGAYSLTATFSDDIITISGTYSGTSSSPSFRIFNNVTNNSIDGFKYFGVSNSNYIRSVRWTDTNYNSIAIDLKDLVQNTAYTIKFKLMGYSGSTAPTEYSPYENVCPIIGYNKLDINIANKNFAKYSLEYVASNNTPLFDKAIYLQPGNYRVLFDTTNATSWRWYIKVFDKDGNILLNGDEITGIEFRIDQLGYLQGANGTTKSMPFTIVKPAYYAFGIRYGNVSSSSTFTNFQLRLSENTYDYEPYNGTTIPITFPSSAGTVYGGYVDIQTSKIVINRNTVIFDGTESFTNYTNSIVCNKNILAGKTIQGSDIITSHTTSAYSHFSNDGKKTIQFAKNKFGVSSINELQTLLTSYVNKGTPFQYSYELDTPIEYDISQVTIKTLLGINNIWASSGAVTMTDPRQNALGLNDGIEYDVSGYCRDGNKNTNIKCSSDTARYLSSSTFDGTSNCFIKANSLPMETKTVSFWIKVNTTSNYIVFADRNTQLEFGKEGDHLNTRTNSGRGTTFASSAIQSGVWYHIVVIKTGDATRRLFINGVEQTAVSTNYFAHTEESLLIGCRYNGAYSLFFNGQISDFRAYSTELSIEDILALYNTPISLSSDGTLLTQGEYVEV